MFKDLRELVQAYKERDPAARSSIEILLLYPGIRAVRNHRRAHWCYNPGLLFLARAISQRSRRITGIEIHPGAKLGRRLVIDHGMGIVIGETAVIKGDILCENIDLWGKVEGNIFVKDTLALKEGCKVDGNLHIRRLSVELGATFNGGCKMISESEFDKMAGVAEQKPVKANQ